MMRLVRSLSLEGRGWKILHLHLNNAPRHSREGAMLNEWASRKIIQLDPRFHGDDNSSVISASA